MPKATWKGHPVYEIGETCGGWVKIAFKMNDYTSPITGTGACWVPMDEVILEEA